MDPFTGLTRALDYIEAHLSGELDCAAAAREAAMSPYQFQRVFSVLCGCPLGEYVRRRRLTLAGAELAAGRPRVIDVSLKYGYDNPESFARAFSRFHGVSPSQVQCGAPLRAFSRVSVRLIMEGGQMMNYSIEERDAMILTGYTRRFWGAPGGDQREDQERDFYVHTRAEQYLLRGLKQIRGNAADYNVISNISDDGYDFSIAARLNDDVRARLCDDTILGERDARRFHDIALKRQLYAVFRTEPSAFPTEAHIPLRAQIFSQWLPASGYALADRPRCRSSTGIKSRARTSATSKFSFPSNARSDDLKGVFRPWKRSFASPPPITSRPSISSIWFSVRPKSRIISKKCCRGWPCRTP